MNEIQPEQVARLERALARERLARKEAERLLEARALELYQANVQLVELNRDLEDKVAKRAAEIETQRSFYQSILHQVPAEIVVLDREYRFVFVSESAVPDPQLRQWLHGKTDFDYCDYRGLDRQQAEERQSRFREVEEKQKIVEWTEHRKRGDWEEYKLRRIFPVYGAKGVLEHFIGYSLDVTESVKYREELIEARDIAQKATSAKSEFLSKISHEIRTPLNAILGLSRILQEEKQDDKREQYLHALNYSAESLLGIVNEVLDFSKIEAGKITFEKIPFDLKHLVKGVLQTFAFRAQERGVKLESEIDPRIPQYLIGDRVKLNQIFLNLISNACKFTEQGFIRVKIEVEAQDTEESILHFQVQDSGIGIPPERLAAVFESFAQAEADTTRKYGGTGLGLAITKKFVEGQGGEIWLESDLGKGSTFHFRLPFLLEKQTFQASGAAQSKEDENVNFANRHLLVAEDNLMNRLVLEKMLEKWLPKVTMVEDGLEALEKLKENKYDLVFLDLQMPGLTGLEVIRQWRDYERAQNLPSTPTVALTADAFSESRQKVLQAGMDDFLTKPVENSELKRVLRRFL